MTTFRLERRDSGQWWPMTVGLPESFATEAEAHEWLRKHVRGPNHGQYRVAAIISRPAPHPHGSVVVVLDDGSTVVTDQEDADAKARRR